MGDPCMQASDGHAGASRPPRSRAAREGKQPPLLRDALQLGGAPFAEAETRARDEVFDRAGDEHLPRLRLLRDTSSDVYCDPANLAVHQLALTGMQACANLQAELAHALADRAGAANRARRPVEPREEAVAGDVELGAAKTEELTADQRMVALEKFAPAPVAKIARLRSRADGVG